MAMGRIEGRAIAVTTTLLAGLVACPSGAQTIVPAPDGTGTQVFSTGNDYTITGGTTASDQQNLFHSFTEFSLGTGASATFSTDPAILNILSRVTGGNPSLIDGLLQVSGSNANLWLINPQGILFGENAALNLQGSFTATTADQVNFATGAWGTVGSTDYGALVGPPHSLQFSLGQPGSVVNAGTLRVSPGESVVLVGGQVLNTGTIAAPGGAIVISAVEGGSLVRLAQAGQLLNLEVATLTEGADDPVPWVPTALPALLTGGAIAIANTVTVNPDGTVQLADGTPVQPASATTTVAGTLDVSGTQGGQLLVLGTDIALAAATLTATGTQGGGTVRIGGDAQGQGPLPRAQTTSVDAASTLAADALSNGAGGRVIVWADDTTTFAGSITARGGSAGGDGGWVETSGRRTLNFAEGRVDASAATGAAGLWLLDPSDITIGSAEAAAIQDSLIVGNSVTISTIDGAPTDIAGPPGSGDITLVSPIVASVTNNAVLTLTASRYIQQAMGFETIDLFGGALVLNVNQEGLAVPGISTVSNALATIGTVTEGTTLNLGAGTYQEEGTIFIDDSLTLNGAGVGSTILDGSISSDRVLTVADDVTVTLSNLTITNGVQAEGGGGGGLLNEGILTILNSAIVGNEAFDTNGGGGISNLGTLTLIGSNVSDNTNNSFSFGFGGGGISNDGSLTLQDSTISGNTTDGDGGGILNNGSLVISNSTLSDNTAVSGGGILNNGSLALENSVLTNNIADFLGGALSNSVDATARITGSTLSSNTADFGGGINNSGTLTITTSTLSNNTATGEFGGGAIGSSGPLTLANSTLNGNLANFGGGLYNRGPLTVSNSTFSGNSAFQIGGGLANFGGDVTVTNSTLSGNRAGDAGGGLSNRGDLLSDGSFTETGQLTVTSSLVSGNTNSSGLRSNLFSDRPFTSGGNNLFGSDGNAGVSGASLAASDIVPLVALSQILNPTLSNNGGPTPTLALVPGSPAIDRGAGANGDQRGQAVVNGIRDIGAFEFTGAEVPPPAPPVPEPPVAPHPPDVPTVTTCVSGDCVAVTPPQGAPEPPTGAAGPVQTYENYLQVQAVAFEDFDALKRAAQITGVTPALVYAQFVTSSGIPVAAAEATAIALPKSLATADPVVAQILAQAEGGPGGTAAADDVLELVLVTGEGEPRRFSTGATRTEVLAAVQQLQRELTDRTRRRLDNYLVPAQALYGWLMAPLEATLQDEAIGHVSFILDEGLRSLPLAALHDGEQYIIENYSVGLMPSLSLTDTRIGDIRNAAVLATGASQFSDQPPLPAVPVELAAINSLWPSEQYLNEAFTPEAIARERAAAAYPILHLATHGQFTNGALGNSYIQFWDRRLGLDQLPQLGLNDPAVELLVLSACRTVLGGEEAELGFAGLAIKSGAKSAIAALWQVSDLETAGLMAELYTQLGQVTYKAEALRQAQLAMLRGDVTVQDGSLVWSGGSTPLPPELTNLALADTRHPFYWSAFTLVGSPW